MEYKLTKHIIREFELSKINGELDIHLSSMKYFIDDIINKSDIYDNDDDDDDDDDDCDWYISDGNYVYFKQKNEFLSCHGDQVWSFFESLKLYNYDEIKELIHYLVSSNINREVRTPYFDLLMRKIEVSSNINREVGIPRCPPYSIPVWSII